MNPSRANATGSLAGSDSSTAHRGESKRIVGPLRAPDGTAGAAKADLSQAMVNSRSGRRNCNADRLQNPVLALRSKRRAR